MGGFDHGTSQSGATELGAAETTGGTVIVVGAQYAVAEGGIALYYADCVAGAVGGTGRGVRERGPEGRDKAAQCEDALEVLRGDAAYGPPLEMHGLARQGDSAEPVLDRLAGDGPRNETR